MLTSGPILTLDQPADHAAAREYLTQRDSYTRRLTRKRKPELENLWHRNHPRAWTARPVSKWSKDELISDASGVAYPDQATALDIYLIEV